MVFLVVVNSTSIVLAEEELNQNDTDNGNFVFNDSESITIRIEGIRSSSISAEKIVTESGNVEKMIVDITSHPLFILAIGAGITGFLLPKFTDKMQARKESFEIKKELIKKINSSTATLLETTKMVARQKIKKEEIHLEFLQWSKSCAEIGATVRAYWNEGKKVSVVEKEWNSYYKMVDALYNVITNFYPKEKHSEIEKDIKKFLKSNDSELRLEYEPEEVDTKTEEFFKTVGERVESKDNAKKYSEALFNLVYLFDKRKYYLLKLIFKNKIKNH